MRHFDNNRHCWLHCMQSWCKNSMCTLQTYYHTITKIDIISPCTLVYWSNKILPYYTILMCVSIFTFVRYIVQTHTF